MTAAVARSLARSAVAGVAALVAVAGWAIAIAPPSQAATPLAVGWWTAARVDATPVGVGTTVSDGALQVAYGASGPVSVAAVRLAAGDRGATLRLPLDRSSTPLPFTVVACETTSAWQHANGGAFAEAPKWDCNLGTTASAFDTTGNTLTWQFDASFVRSGIVDVALVPIAGSQPFVATSTVPGPDSAQALGGAEQQQLVEPTPPLPTAEQAATAPSQTVAGSAPTVHLAVPAQPAATSAPSSDGGLSPLPTTLRAPLRRVASPGVPAVGRAIGLLLLVAAALVAAATALGLRVPWIDVSAEAQRGVGRFRAPRHAKPEPV